MCGFAGFYDPQFQNKDKLAEKLAPMISCILHRGPDDSGEWFDPSAGLALGHRRLSILDVSENGRQPMVSKSGRYIIIFNGEIYNHLELRKTHLSDVTSNQYKSSSDTETLLYLFDKIGFRETLEQVKGMFAIVLWDKQEQKLYFARDRFGKKPLYLGWVGGALVFGSELKSIRAFSDMRPEVSTLALKNYLRFGYITAPYCIYDGFISLPAGGFIEIESKTIKEKPALKSLIQFYWNCIEHATESHKQSEYITDAQAINMVDKALTKSVTDRLLSDVPLGAFLSGGIDSSAIVALMCENMRDRVKTFTIGFEEHGFDEAKFAKRIAYHLGTEHHELYLKSTEARDIIPLLPQVYDEPFADISQIPTYLVSKFAREDVTVALSGDGGDELFGGYNRHVQGPGLWRNMQWMPVFLRNYVGKKIGHMGPEFWQKLRPGNPQFGERMMKVGRAFSARDEDHLYRLFLSQWSEPDNLLQNEVTDNAQSLFETDEFGLSDDFSFSEKMMIMDTLHYLPNDVLTKVDRASMANSLEARCPFLDTDLFDTVWQLPIQMKIREKESKWLLRQILYRYIPRNMVERPKMGFNVPIYNWIKGPLRDWAEHLLDPHKMHAQGYLNPAPIHKAWQDHLEGRANNGYRLWAILMFQSWLDVWMR